jgi:hypothetical protein
MCGQDAVGFFKLNQGVEPDAYYLVLVVVVIHPIL